MGKKTIAAMQANNGDASYNPDPTGKRVGYRPEPKMAEILNEVAIELGDYVHKVSVINIR